MRHVETPMILKCLDLLKIMWLIISMGNPLLGEFLAPNRLMMVDELHPHADVLSKNTYREKCMNM